MTLDSSQSPIIRLPAFWRNAAVFVIYALIYIFTNLSAFAHLDAAYFGGADGRAGFYVWLTAQNITRLINLPANWFDSGIFYPMGSSLAYSDNFLLPSLTVALLQWAGLPATSAFNITLLLAAALNGFITYRLALYLCGSRPAAFLAGFFFMNLPYLHDQVAERPLQFAFFLPWAALTALRYLETRRLKSAALTGWLLLGAFLCSVYYSLLSALLLLLVFLGYALARGRSLRSAELLKAVLINVPPMLLLAILGQPYLAVRAELGAWRLTEVSSTDTSLLSFLAAPAGNLLWGSISGELSPLESRFFPGAIMLLLLLGCIPAYARLRCAGTSSYPRIEKWLGRLVCAAPCLCLAAYLDMSKNSSWKAGGAALLTTASLWIMLGALTLWLVLAGARRTKSLALESSEKMLLLGWLAVLCALAWLGLQHSPLAPPVGIAAVLCGSALAAFGLQYLMERFRFSKLQSTLLCLILACLAGMELACRTFDLTPETQPAEIYQRFNSKHGKDAVIALPLGSAQKDPEVFAKTQVRYLFWLQPSRRRLVNGYNAKMPRLLAGLGAKLSNFPDDGSLRALGAIVGLHYVIFNSTLAPDFEKELFEERARSFGPLLKLMDQDEYGNYLFRISPAPALSRKTLEVYLPPSRAERALSFELLRGAAADCSQSVRVGVGPSDAKAVRQSKYVTLNLPNAGKKFSFTVNLPPSNSLVAPHKATFVLSGSCAEGLSVRKLKVVE